jgi:hypothetical protein
MKGKPISLFREINWPFCGIPCFTKVSLLQNETERNGNHRKILQNVKNFSRGEPPFPPLPSPLSVYLTFELIVTHRNREWYPRWVTLHAILDFSIIMTLLESYLNNRRQRCMAVLAAELILYILYCFLFLGQKGGGAVLEDQISMTFERKEWCFRVMGTKG